jgi:outer membrane lipoprotein-sorting protein
LRSLKGFLFSPRLLSFLFFSFFLINSPDGHAELTRESAAALLTDQHDSLASLKVSLDIGVPHETEPTVQWASGIAAFQKNPDYLLLKGYKPLVPLYFALKSNAENFWLYFPRNNTVRWGPHDAVEKNPDLDLTLIARDIRKALTTARVRPEEIASFKILVYGYRLTLKHPSGAARREIDFDFDARIREITEFSEAEQPTLRISKSDWRQVNGMWFPSVVKIKRILPRPNDLILHLKDIRPNAPLEPKILEYEPPADATWIQITE